MSKKLKTNDDTTLLNTIIENVTILQTVSAKLSWSHLLNIIYIENKNQPNG